MTKILIDLLSFAKIFVRNDKGIASFGPVSGPVGIGALGLGFCFFFFGTCSPTRLHSPFRRPRFRPAY